MRTIGALVIFFIGVASGALGKSASVLPSAQAALSAHDWPHAVAILTAPATAGNVKAQRMLGDVYKSQASNYPYPSTLFWDADRWYRIAASHGDEQVQFELAMLLMEGHNSTFSGVALAEETAESKVWFETAAKSGHLSSQYMLAQQLDVPESQLNPISPAVYKSCAQAVAWYSRAVKSGNYAKRYKKLHPEDYAGLRFWAAAEYELGEHYQSGCGIKQNQSIGTALKEKSLRDGHIVIPYPPIP